MNKLSEHLKSWLERVSSNERPADSIVAYNLGLFETELGYSVYFIGSDRFDESDEDWACVEAFSPSEKYCALPDTAGLEWNKVLEMVLKASKDFIGSESGRQSFMASAEAVTVGFDSGNLERVK